MTSQAWFRDGLTGRHVLIFMLAFFGAVFAITGSFLWIAFKTFPGDNPAAYRRGLYYNRTLAEAARQDRLGWQIAAAYEIGLRGEGHLVVRLADSAGRALTGEQVVARLGRPATDRFDRSVALESRGEAYAASIQLDPGSWDVELRVNAQGEGTPFNAKLRIWIEERP